MNRLTRRAYTPGFNKISDDKVKAALRKFGYGELLDENEYTWTAWQNVDHQGAQGGYAYQVVGLGINNPMIYFAELHEFTSCTNDTKYCAIIVWRIDDSGNVVTPAVDVQLYQGSYSDNAYMMGDNYHYKLVAENNSIKFLYQTWEAALKAAKKYIYDRNQKLIDDIDKKE